MRPVPERDDSKEVPTQPRTSRRNRSEGGASLVEYVLLISLIMAVCVIGVTYLGESVKNSFDSTGSTIETIP